MRPHDHHHRSWKLLLVYWHVQIIFFSSLFSPLTLATASSYSNSSSGNLTTSTLSYSSRLLQQKQSRIVGGSAAPLGEYPSFAWWDQGCGATLVHEDIALTAAHCYLGNPGILYFNSITLREGYQAAVEYVRIHPDYNGNRDDPDIDYMILKLVHPVPPEIATPNVIINSNPNIPNASGEPLVVVGFGRLQEGDTNDSETLQHLIVPYVTNDQCAMQYGHPRINNAMLCAGEENKDACQGMHIVVEHRS
jgi:secreted trypsin-like serine protease